MYRNSKPYSPNTKGEIWDLLGRMTLGSPTFVDKTGFFSNRSIETELFALNEGLKRIRPQLGEAAYQRLADFQHGCAHISRPIPKTRPGNLPRAASASGRWRKSSAAARAASPELPRLREAAFCQRGRRSIPESPTAPSR